MSTTKKPQKNSSSTFNINNNTISKSAIGDNSSVVNNESIDNETLSQFSSQLLELQNEINGLSQRLSQNDVVEAQSEVSAIERQVQKPKIDPQIIINSLDVINRIFTKVGFVSTALKHLFDIGQSFLGR